MAQFLLDCGLSTKAGTPLGKASVKRILTNRAYLGFTLHKGEYFPGSFAAILSPILFEAVQTKLAERCRPPRSRKKHDFAFTNLLRCGECGGMITAQWGIGQRGGRYRYYRCTKKFGVCHQKYVQEGALVEQFRAQLQSVSLPESWVSLMLSKVSVWERELTHASGSRVGQLKMDILERERKLDSLVDLFLNGDIERARYLEKKDVLQRESLARGQTESCPKRAKRMGRTPAALDSTQQTSRYFGGVRELCGDARFSAHTRNEPHHARQDYCDLILPTLRIPAAASRAVAGPPFCIRRQSRRFRAHCRRSFIR